MRIVGGKFKGRVLKEFSLNNIRPTADNVRESIFNIINCNIEDSTFLDLYSGTGAVGIEAISRGAKFVSFNDLSKDSIALVKENLKKLGLESGYDCSIGDGLSFLQTSRKKYDYVFIDPPYKGELQYKSVCLAEMVLNDDGTIILEDEKPFDFEIDNLIKYDERRYGRVCLSFFKKAKREDKSCIFAGTFDPVTKGHLWVINECLKRFKKVYVVIGVNSEKTPLFTAEERLSMLKTALIGKDVIIDSFDGLMVDYMQKNNIDIAVRGIRNDSDYKYEKKMLENNKTYYNKYQTLFLYPPKSICEISSTLVKDNLTKNKDFSLMVADNTYSFIKGKLNKE